MRASVVNLVALLLPQIAFSQTAPAFEVASVRLSPPMDRSRPNITTVRGGPGTNDPTSISFVRYLLGALIIYAYDLKYYQLDLSDSRLHDQFDVAANVPEGATKEQVRAMMRNLLAERFHLRVHWQKKPGDVYSLVQAKGGHKLRPASSEKAPDPDNATATFTRPPMGKDGLAELPRGVSMLSCAYKGCKMQQINANLDLVREYLEDELKAPVSDAAGLEGKFDYVLGWAPSGTREPDDPPVITTAITEQLGLRLDKRKGEVETLVVDSVDRAPTGN